MGQKLFKIHLVAGARPNFIKIAPLYFQLKTDPALEVSIVHTGQHYDTKLNQNIWEDLDLPNPDFFLEAGGGTPSSQTATILSRYAPLLSETQPDLVIVVGDVTSTFAATLAAKHVGIRVAHVEAGLRSFDLKMPEELNRLLTDSIADFLWTPSEDANQNLLREGRKIDSISLVGNIMIDSLVRKESAIDQDPILKELSLNAKGYALLTFHRPSNVDNKERLEKILRVSENLSQVLPVIFPVHPRTRKRIQEFNIPLKANARLKLIDPLGYVAFSKLLKEARFVVTDSGGVQEETSYHSVPCLTVRNNTERPVTITLGTNQLVRLENLEKAIGDLKPSSKTSIPFWDGKTSERIHAEIRKLL